MRSVFLKSKNENFWDLAKKIFEAATNCDRQLFSNKDELIKKIISTLIHNEDID